MNPIQKLTNEIIDYGRLIIVAAIMIFVVYEVIKTLAGDLPANIAAIIIGLGGIFIFATNRKVRDSFNDWLNKR